MADNGERKLALAGWTLLGIGVTFGFSVVVLGGFVHLVEGGGSWWFTGHNLEQGQWYEAVRNTVAMVALTVAGGAAYLAYRRQRTADLTQQTTAAALEVSSRAYGLSVDRHDADGVGQLRSRFSEAAELLAHSSAAVRTAGVYSLASIADDWATRKNRLEVQVCVDVLCGYMRLPYEPEIGRNHLSKKVVRHARGGIGKTLGGTEERHFEYRQNDKVVRQAIIRVIRNHLQQSSEPSWSDRNFDFTDVVFEDAHLMNAVFAGETTSFIGAVFLGDYTSFDRASFSEPHTSFARAAFRSERTLFDGAVFSGQEALFHDATFSGELTSFSGVKFDGALVDFDNTIFESRVTDFSNSRFGGDRAAFENSQFVGLALFNEVRFGSREAVDFASCTFFGGSSFADLVGIQNFISD